MLKFSVAAFALALWRPAFAERIVAVAPISILGVQDKSDQTTTTIAEVEQAIATIPGYSVIPTAKVAALIDRAKKPRLKSCEGDVACVTELGRLVGAHIVVTGEVGGLGSTQVVYLGAVDIATGKDIRSTTLTVGADRTTGGAIGAAIRLLDPDKYVGTVRLAIDVPGAAVFVNGKLMTLSDGGEVTLSVGTQALRVTHPQFRDFIKFVTVAYGRNQDISVEMAKHPIIQRDFPAQAAGVRRTDDDHRPLYRRWYVAVPAILALSIGTGFTVAAIAHRFPEATGCRTPADPACK